MDKSAVLFPTDLPTAQWAEFPADGFSRPACGLVYRLGRPATNGVPLGGVDTGCLDLDTNGLFGYCTIFDSHVPRRGPINLPPLGMSVGGETWVLCANQPRPYETTDGRKPIEPVLAELGLDGVKTAREIHYWGHYPVADVEFDTDAPVSVGLRAWTPFLPGDVRNSMIPGIVFEVRLRNPGSKRRKGTLAFSFPGPTEREAGTGRFERRDEEGRFNGVAVSGGRTAYALGVVGAASARLGGALDDDGAAWARIADALPEAGPEHAGASVAVDFSLGAGKAKTVRFVLTWCSPQWKGGGHPSSTEGNTFTHMYALRYPDPAETAQRLARGHARLLRRVHAWQQAVYTDASLPVWLRDSLVNALHMITEDGMWAAAEPPIPKWARKRDGLFGMNECPRGCPQIECIPCSFYGSLPIAYFFPGLELSTLRGYKGYQYEDGAPPWIFGGCTGQSAGIDFATPTRGYQFATNGISLASLVDQFLMCHDTPDGKYLREFYPMVKRNMIYTVNLRTTPEYSLGERIISMPDENVGTEWFEAPEPGWAGMTAHVGGLHIAQLRIAERMATQVGDADFARQCAEWIALAQEAMEKRLWTGSYYLNFLEPETGRRSELVFGYQLDGEWITSHHDLPGTLPDDRVRTVLDTVKRFNAAVTRHGAVNYTNADGTPADVKGYGTYSYFPPEVLMLAMTYMYAGEREFGLELARRCWENIVCGWGYAWDMPNIMRGDADTGESVYGHDYYQDMMIWSLPAVLAGQDLSGPVKPGGLVDRVLQAARPG